MYPMINKYFFLINFAIFQAIWALGVLGQHSYLIVSLGLLGGHFLLSPSPFRDLQALAAISSIGIAVDLTLTSTGVFVFEQPLIPLWLVMIWGAFALSLNHGLHWLSKWPAWSQAVLGGAGGAGSYIAGHKLDAVTFGFDLITSGFILAAIWALLMPLFFFLLKKIDIHALPTH